MPFVADAPAKTGGFVPDEMAAAVADPTGGSEQRLREKEAVGVRTQVRKEEEDFVKQNRVGAVPINTRRALPSGLRARLSAEPDPAVQAKMLTERGMPARVTKDGKNVLVRQASDDGNEEDVPLHPFGGVTLGTVAGEAVPLAKLAANVGIGLLSGGSTAIPALAAKIGVRPLLAAATTMGTGAAAVEGAATGGSRLLAGQPLGDTGKRALAEGAINAALPLTLEGLRAGGAWTLGKLGGAGAAENELTRAATNLDLPLTGSMARDSQVLRGAERAGGTSRFDEEQSKALFAARDKIQRPTDTPVGPLADITDAEVSKRVQPIFALAEEAEAAAVRGEMTAAQKVAQTELQSQLDSGIIPSTIKIPEGGSFIRSSIIGNKDLGIKGRAGEFREEAQKLFTPVNEMFEAEGLRIPTSAVTALKDEVDEKATAALLELAPGIKKIANIESLLTQGTPPKPGKSTGIFDEFGRPVMGKPTAGTPPPQLTLSQARELKNAVHDALQLGLAPGEAGIPNRYLSRLAKALDDDMDAGIKSGSPEFQAAEKKATDYYRTKIQPLQQSDVAKLFLKTDAAGRLGDDEIINRLVSGKGNLDAMKAYKEVLGAGSSEYQLLRRLTVNSLMDEAKAGGEMIDAGKFFNRVFNLNPGLQEEILGPLAKTIRANTRLMERAQGANIPTEELLDALSAAPAKVGARLEAALAREEAYSREFAGSTQKMLRDGVLTARTMGPPEEFVGRFIFNPKVGESEVRQALTQIAAADPAAAEMLRRRTVARIMEDTKAAVKPGEMSTEAINVAKLRELVKGDAGANARVVIGKDGVQFLDDLLTYVVGNERRNVTGKAAAEVAPSDIAGRGAAAAIGHKISIARMAADVALALPRFALGKSADISPTVRRYLTTGELPSLGSVALKTAQTPNRFTGYGGVAKGAMTEAERKQTEREAAGLFLASPAAVRGTTKILADTENERQETDLPLARK